MMKRVLKMLEDAGDSGTVAMITIDSRVASLEALGSILMEAIGYREKASGIFTAIDKFWYERKQPLTLLVSNLDELRHELVQLFLQDLRVRVDSRQVVVLLGGGQNFREFVYGPNSEFTCATQILVQGFDSGAFSELIDEYRKLVHFKIEGRAAQALWKVTGGQVPVLRYLIEAAVDNRARAHRDHTVPLTASEVNDLVQKLSVSPEMTTAVFDQALDTLWLDSDCRIILEDLLASKPCKAPLEPGALELAGVTIRQGEYLQFSSILAKNFFEEHLTSRRRADLCAVAGDWESAFHRFRKLNNREWVRPDSAQDRNEVERVIQMLTGHIAASATHEEAYLLFCDAVQYILGFTEISWWRWAHGWKLDPGSGTEFKESVAIGTAASFPEEHAYDFAQSLPRKPKNCSKWIDLAAPWNRIAVAATIEVSESTTPLILAVSDAGLNRSISQDRLRIVKTLIAAFLSASGRARYSAFLQRQLSLVERRISVFDAILDTIDDLEMDRFTVCRRIAQAIRNLGYRRVLICLLDSKRQRIQGVCDESDQPTIDVARMTDYALADSTDIQPVVIMSRTPFVTSDAHRERLVNLKVAEATGLSAFAIVPMIDHDGNPVGTIHVEREDRRVPSALEVEELTRIGKRVALVLEDGERTNLINSALDRIPDPLAIADASVRWRYANKSASDSLRIPKGWRRWGHAEEISNDLHRGEIKKYVLRSLDSPAREDYLVAKQITELCAPEDHYHLSTAPIRDATSIVTGAVVTLREFSKIQALVTAVGAIIRAGTVQAALQAVLDAMNDLDHLSARIYLIRKQEGKEFLVSCVAIGLDQERLAKFNAQGVVLAERALGHHSWTCIEYQEGRIFTWRPDGNDGEVIQTKSGLDAEVVTNPDHVQELGKKPGDFWMDLPLIAGNGGALGKLASHIPDDLNSQQFWILQILAAFAAVTIETFTSHEQQEDERKRWEEGIYQKSLATVAHHLWNRVVALDPLLLRYQKAEKRPLDLPRLNKDFETLLVLMYATVKRAKEFLRSPKPELKRMDLNSMCKRVWSSHVPKDIPNPEYQCAAGQVIVSADEDLVSLALAEVLDNSRKAVRGVLDARIRVDLETMDDWAVIRVHDNGCGIPPENHEGVFADDYSAWPDGKERGSGLGLGWIRRVFRNHEGDVTIAASPLLGGTTFVLTLPHARSTYE
jgi:hypothetical protein